MEFKYYGIDHFWKNALKVKNNFETVKYITLPDLIKSALSLQNGDEEVGRSPSDNKNTLTKELLWRILRMNEETIAGFWRAKEYVGICKNP